MSDRARSGDRPDGASHETRRKLALGSLVLIIAFSTLSFVASSVFDYRAFIAARMHDTQNLAETLAEHADQTFRSVALALAKSSEIYLARKELSRLGTVPASRDFGVTPVLYTMTTAMPQLLGIAVVDASGVLAASTVPVLDRPAVSADFLDAHATDTASNVRLHAPRRDILSDRWVIPVSRSFFDREGGFAGVAVGAVDPDYFQHFFAALEFGEKDVIALHTLAGALLARFPGNASLLGRNVSASPMFRFIAEHLPQGSTANLLMFDGVRRLASYAGARQFPLVVIVGMNRTALLGWWWRHLRWQVLGLGVVSAALAFAALQVARQFNRQDRLLRDLVSTRDEAAYLAQHDALTGLPNRRLFGERIREALAAARLRRERVAVFFLDLDQFKDVNDTLGHRVGDRVLAEIGARLRRVVRSSDTLARLGGDEFAIVQTGLSEAEGAMALAGKLFDALKAPVVVDESELDVSASLGVTLFPDDAVSAKVLLQNADLALYQAKSQGRRRIAFFSADLAHAASERMALMRDLREAVALRQLSIAYQPLVHLRSGRTLGFEALARWHHPRRGAIAPETFIRLAELNGLIGEIGSWVLREACTQAASWQRVDPDLVISVNASTVQMRQAEFLPNVEHALRRSGLQARHLQLEITESLALESADTLIERALGDVAARGVSLAIDDFGTGYSSLAYLKKFRIDCIKIDRSFVAGIGRAADDEAIVRAIVALGRSLGKVVIAEGVETAGQLQFLRDLGCDAAQGFYLGEPVAAGDVVLPGGTELARAAG